MHCDGSCIRTSWTIMLLATSTLNGAKEHSSDIIYICSFRSTVFFGIKDLFCDLQVPIYNHESLAFRSLQIPQD